MTEGPIAGAVHGRNVTQKDIDLEHARNRGRVQLALARGGVAAVCIACSTFPLKFLYFAVKELAGKDTRLSIGLTISLTVVGAAGLVKILVDRKKMSQQSKEILRLRQDLAVMEDRMKR